MPVAGRLSKINVQPGDKVRAGQVLAELDAVAKTEAQAKLLEAREVLESAKSVRKGMNYGRATDDFLKKLQAQIDLSKKTVTLMRNIYKEAENATERAQALINLTNAESNRDKLISDYNWYTGKASDDDKASADTKLALAQARYDAARAALDRLQVVAPFDGVILENNASIGTSFPADESLFKIADPKALEVKANVTEEDYPLLSTGMETELFFDARADVTVKGKVLRIVPKRIGNDRPLYNIYISLDTVPDGLVEGMTSDAAVTIAKRAGVLCLPRAVVRASGGSKAAIKVWTGLQSETRQVEIGLRGDAYVEILSGLKKGEQVVTK
jgi:RND family efflux transporter MFP subunit